VVEPSNGIAGAALGLLGIFLPGFLVLIGTLPFWDAFRQRVSAVTHWSLKTSGDEATS
jgi:chromate transporter